MKAAREITLTVVYEIDDYQRWVAAVVECPEIVAYGETSEEAGATSSH
jgi:predicted RNase H-like HicB family nuclease